MSSTSLEPLETSRATTLVTRYFSPWPIVSPVTYYSHGRWGYFVCLANCIRQEKNYCRIQWQANSVSPPDPFQLDTQTSGSTIAAGGSTACVLAQVVIPDGSDNGLTPLSAPISTMGFRSKWCGAVLGYDGQTAAMSVVCKSRWIMRFILTTLIWKYFSYLLFSCKNTFQSGILDSGWISSTRRDWF